MHPRAHHGATRAAAQRRARRRPTDRPSARGRATRARVRSVSRGHPSSAGGRGRHVSGVRARARVQRRGRRGGERREEDDIDGVRAELPRSHGGRRNTRTTRREESRGRATTADGVSFMAGAPCHRHRRCATTREHYHRESESSSARGVRLASAQHSLSAGSPAHLAMVQRALGAVREPPRHRLVREEARWEVRWRTHRGRESGAVGNNVSRRIDRCGPFPLSVVADRCDGRRAAAARATRTERTQAPISDQRMRVRTSQQGR